MMVCDIFQALVNRAIELKSGERHDVLQSFASDLFTHDRDAIESGRLDLSRGALWGIYSHGTHLVHLAGDSPVEIVRCIDRTFPSVAWHRLDRRGVIPVPYSEAMLIAMDARLKRISEVA